MLTAASYADEEGRGPRETEPPAQVAQHAGATLAYLVPASHISHIPSPEQLLWLLPLQVQALLAGRGAFLKARWRNREGVLC